MSYTLSKSDGYTIGVLMDGNINTSYTSLTLIGKNFAGYGEYLNENFIKLTENFANSSEPSSPMQGQLWWDTAAKLLKVRNGTSWKAVSSTTSSASSPAVGTVTVGDMWWDINNAQLKVWSGSDWVIVGPAYSAQQGRTGIEASTVIDTANNSRILLKFYVNNVLTAVLSRDQSYQTNSLTGFGSSEPVTINPGFNLATGGATPLRYYGDANNAINLGNYPASDYVRAGQTAPTFTQPLTVNNSYLTVGTTTVDPTTKDFSILVDSTSVKLMSNVSGKDLIISNKVNDVVQQLITLDGHTGAVIVKNDPTPTGHAQQIATKNYVDTAISITGPALMRNGDNTITGVISPASNNAFDVGTSSARFATIYSTTFNGTATNALALGGLAANTYARTDSIANFANQATFPSAGIVIGDSGDFTIDVNSTSVNLKSNTLNKNVNLSVKTSANVATTSFTVDGLTGLMTILPATLGAAAYPISLNGVATKGYVDLAVTSAVGGSASDLTAVNTHILPTQDNVFNVGSSSLKWNTVYATTFEGTAMQANYADLAERFEADQTYTPGTVVEMGGTAEITAAATDLSDNVFGVISTNAAYLMNAAAGTNNTHPPVAMQGRVPVRVIGTVRKGDRLVSAGNGMARAALKSEITPFNVIGRALQNKLTNSEGTVEAIVKINS